MGSRLQLKYGLVAEQDRLSTSADTLLVNEPVTGSKSRTKGNLYLLVSSAGTGGRTRDATALVAQTISREYYYDESAGIPICLEKGLRSASRKLRSSREGSGLPAGCLGVAVAVVRTNELYLATVGNVDAYLVRAARLLMPEHAPAPGIPADDHLRVDVWRGEFAVGDSLLLVSRNLTEVVGTEELKNAVVTLHPQSAVEHLHHLFVAAGGDGSDAVLAIEASEFGDGRPSGRVVPITPAADPYGELATGSPIPLADPMMGAATAVGGKARSAAGSVTGAFGGFVDRIFDSMPRRRTSTRRIQPQVSRREAQRRAAIAILAFLVVVLVLGVAITFWPHGKENTPVGPMGQGEQALNDATNLVNQALGPDGTVVGDPVQATKLLREAYADAQRAAQSGIPADATAPVIGKITNALNGLYDVHFGTTSQITGLPAGTDPTGLERGSDGALYYIDKNAATVSRVDPTKTGAKPIAVISAGDGPGVGIGSPKLESSGVCEVVIVDIRGGVWRWRPSDNKGNGTLGKINLSDTPDWTTSVTGIETLATNSQQCLYNLYVIDPTSNQILKYSLQAAGGGFSPPVSYLSTSTEAVDSFLALQVDGDIYALTSSNVVKHYNGQLLGFKLQTPPDDGDLRPGHDYRLIAGTGDHVSGGQLYVYDAKWNRILVFDKKTGDYLEQWLSTSSSPPMANAQGMVLLPGTIPPSGLAPTNGPVATPSPGASHAGTPTVLYWVSPTGVERTTFVDAPNDSGASPAPSGSPTASGATPRPTKTPKH